LGVILIELGHSPYSLSNRTQCKFSDRNFKQVISRFCSQSYKRVKNLTETERTLQDKKCNIFKASVYGQFSDNSFTIHIYSNSCTKPHSNVFIFLCHL